jgi:hypothetical protein
MKLFFFMLTLSAATNAGLNNKSHSFAHNNKNNIQKPLEQKDILIRYRVQDPMTFDPSQKSKSFWQKPKEFDYKTEPYSSFTNRLSNDVTVIQKPGNRAFSGAFFPHNLLAKERKDYFLTQKPGSEAFECASVFAIVTNVRNFYVKSIYQMKTLFPDENKIFSSLIRGIKGKDDIKPLTIVPYVNEKNTAYYDQASNRLNLGYFTQKRFGGLYRKKHFFCQSPDIIMHEMGHYILYRLKPDWQIPKLMRPIKKNPERLFLYNSLHEAFADLTVLFMLLDDESTIEKMLIENNHNLRTSHVKHFLALFSIILMKASCTKALLEETVIS